MLITVEVPDALAEALHLDVVDGAAAALEAMALEAFRERKLSEYQLRTLLGIQSRFDLWEFLKQRRVETYSVEEFDRDLAVMNAVPPRG
jgi:hypothetical protein